MKPEASWRIRGRAPFTPREKPVTAVGTAMIATQAVMRRVSSFCRTEVDASFSAATVRCVLVRVW